MTLDEQEDYQLFVVTYFARTNTSSNSCLIDNNITNHMTNDENIFIELDKNIISKVKIENGDFS